MQIDLDAPIRGVPLWLMREYLEELGGEAVAVGEVVGPGWRALLTQVEDFALGSLRIGQVRLELMGEPEAVAPIRAALSWKLMTRGGG